MFSTLRNAWKIPELRKKLLFTLMILFFFRVGGMIPVPFINGDLLSAYYQAQLSTTVLGLLNAMSGSAFSQARLFALSIQPYINASIIIELLTIAIPALERMAKEEGEEGRKKINKITRYTTIGIAFLTGFAYYIMLKNYGTNPSILKDTGVFPAIIIILSFMAGASLVTWLGEQITDKGIGNGISMILFAGIISRVPQLIATMISSLQEGTIKWYTCILLVIGVLLLIAFIAFMTNSERRISVQYAKRVVGRKVYGGQNTNLPIKVNMSGVLPIIFAQSIASVPATICAFTGTTSGWWYENVFDSSSTVYAIIYFLLIIAFSYFYASVQYNPVEIANNLKKNGGFIPGFRPGRPTAEFIAKTINKIVLFGAIFLAVVALLPIIAGNIIGVPSLAIGGTSVIIVVGVANETVQAIEAQMLMRHYKGFLD